MEASSISNLSQTRVIGVCAAVFALTGVILCSGCTYESPVVYHPSTFDRAWSAAIRAAQDEGVRISSEDRGSGIISGNRGRQEITIYVRTQAEGKVRLEFSVRGPREADPGLADRISRAYNRYMGR